ncbi:hypothetical protein R3P38DRAFT_3380461 [Favolaschia claudopus]|uniref:Uncharacterized protein n=1 Tax=Favolaschia claudopus TaxID=2862362 RepID=A0AAV9Z1V8_9AGAR
MSADMSEGHGVLAVSSSYTPIYTPASPNATTSPSPRSNSADASVNEDDVPESGPTSRGPYNSSGHFQPAGSRDIPSLRQPSPRPSAPRPVILVPRLISAPIHAANSSDDEIVEVDPPSYVQSITESGTTSASRRRGRRVRAPLPLVNLTGLPEGRARRTLPLPRNPPTARSQHVPPARPRISPKWDPPLVTSGSTFSRLTQCLKMVVDLSQPYAEFARGDTTASILREQARNDDNRIPSVLEILYNNRLKARLTKAFILLLQAQENYETAHGQPHSLLPGSNVICHYLNLPTLPDELARLSSPNHSYSDWEPFHAALYSIFGDYSESPLIRSILERAPLAPHLVDVPYYLKANMTAVDPLVRQLAAIRQIFQSVIGRLSIVTGEVQRLQSSTQLNSARRDWHSRYGIPASVVGGPPPRFTYPPDMHSVYGAHPLLYPFEVDFLRWAAVAITSINPRLYHFQKTLEEAINCPSSR